MRILWITNIPSPYRVDFFSELGKYCELTVLFERAASLERDSSWKQENFANFRGIVMSSIRFHVDRGFTLDAIKMLRREKYDRIIVSDIASPTGILTISYLKWKRIAYYLESDGGFPGTGVGAKEWFKRNLLKGAVGYFSTAELHDAYYKTYGAQAGQLIRYHFSSVKNEQLLSEVISDKERAMLKKQLGMTEKNVVLSIGQFIYRKGIDVLLKAHAEMDDDVGLYIIGGTPTQDYLNIVEENHLRNVHFLPFMAKDEVWRYYRAADIFALPTREDIWGLVVNEAMANGLPVITTDRCISGLEMVKDGWNGYIVPSEDYIKLSESIHKALQWYENGAQQRKNALDVARKYTIERMVEDHIKVLICEDE